MPVTRRTISVNRSAQRQIGRPNGVIQGRVQATGPERFGVIAVDCAKQRCKWMLCNFYGKVIIEPLTVECNRSSLSAMTNMARLACETSGIEDVIVAVELTGIYHRPVVAAFRQAKFETREVHPYASKHFRDVLHPDRKTDNNDLEAIFQAAIAGFGLIKPEPHETYHTLQLLARHRRNLVQQRARLMVQIRNALHQIFPGYADLFSEEKFFERTIAIDVVRKFQSAEQIRKAGVVGVSQFLQEKKIAFRAPTVHKIVSWSTAAADPGPAAELHHQLWCELEDIRQRLTQQIDHAECKMAGFLAQTPYCLLLSVKGINVVTAAELAAEAGPIEYYASARSMNGRAGLFPSCYQSDAVNKPNGPLARNANRRLRSALMRIAECVSRHHPKYQATAARWKGAGVHALDWHCRIANRVSRLVFQLVSGRKVYSRQGLKHDAILAKLLAFCQEHKASPDLMAACLTNVMDWLPKSAYDHEGESLRKVKKTRHFSHISEIVPIVLVRLLGGTSAENVIESTKSEP